MKKWWLLLYGIGCVFSAGAQNNFFFGHYMFNPSWFNPAWIGGEAEGFVAFQHRSQWLGYNTSFYGSGGAPTTQMITAMMPIEGPAISAVGLSISNDQLGAVRNFQLQIPVSFTREFRFGTVSLGISPGLFSQTLDFGQLDPNEPGDEKIPQIGSQTEIQPDLNAGLFFRSDNGTWLGASAVNILEPGFSYGVKGLENTREISFALHGGRQFSVKESLVLNPVFLVRSDLKGVTFDAGIIATLKDKMWGGLSYRRRESAILYLGYSLLPDNKLKIGYSFDYVLRNQDGKAPTSHEVFVRYDLPNLVLGGRKAVKTPRFSF